VDNVYVLYFRKCARFLEGNGIVSQYLGYPTHCPQSLCPPVTLSPSHFIPQSLCPRSPCSLVILSRGHFVPYIQKETKKMCKKLARFLANLFCNICLPLISLVHYFFFSLSFSLSLSLTNRFCFTYATSTLYFWVHTRYLPNG
jgi:hypothetical protein